jgi:hypothetical protein
MLNERARTERGTVALAMIVLMICAATAGLLVSRNLSAAHQTVDARHRAQALAAADAGVAEMQALHSIGDIESPQHSGTLGEASWSTDVAPVSDDSIVITSTGDSEGWSATVAASVTRAGAGVEVTGWHQVSGGPSG